MEDEQMTTKLDAMIHDGRYLAAQRLWEEMKVPDSLPSDMVAKMLCRAEEVKQALVMEGTDDEWNLGHTMLGVTTHYKIGDSGCVTVRMEGVLDNLPIFEQCSVAYEVDLYKQWLPFLSQSMTMAKVGPAELIPYLSWYIPPLSRDSLLQCYAADCLQEEQKVVIIGKSIESWPDVNPPFQEIGWFHNRLDLKEFKAVMHVLSPNSCKTTIIACVDPRTILPQFILNFAIRNLAGMLLYLFQQQSIKVAADPLCLHSQRIRDNKEFYREWLHPKLKLLCETLGWQQPTVAAFDHSDSDHLAADIH